MLNHLDLWSNVASILTFVVTVIGGPVGIYGYIVYRRDWNRKRKDLEDHLEKEKQADIAGVGLGTNGQRTATHIIRHLKLTQDEIIKLAYDNPKIGITTTKNPTTYFADTLLFEYLT